MMLLGRYRDLLTAKNPLELLSLDQKRHIRAYRFRKRVLGPGSNFAFLSFYTSASTSSVVSKNNNRAQILPVHALAAQNGHCSVVPTYAADATAPERACSTDKDLCIARLDSPTVSGSDLRIIAERKVQVSMENVSTR